MKESKFIELLNLHVDHQISPVESELLESEVRSNPARRQIYREYCQIQQGCSVLAQAFRAGAPANEAKIVGFKPQRSVGVSTYAAGILAVAACAALFVGLRSRTQEPVVLLSESGPTPLASTTLRAPAVAVAQTPAARQPLQPVFGPRGLTLRDPLAEPTEVASADEAAFGDWMHGVQLSSLPVTSSNALRFDAKAALPDSRTYRSVRPIQGKVEWTAFTFQK